MFEKVPEYPPPHFISGVPIETQFENDLLREFADDIGASPQDLAIAIFKTLGDVMFVMPHLSLVGNEITIDSAMGYHFDKMVHRIKIGRYI